MGFGEKLSFLRKQHGMTQMELAEKLDISRQAVSKWEQGTSEPSTENLISIGKLFGVSIETLIDDGLQLQDGVSVQVAVQEREIDGSKNDNGTTKLIRQLIVDCLVTVIIVLAILFCYFRWRPIYQENQNPISVDELGKTELTDEPSSSFHMNTQEE